MAMLLQVFAINVVISERYNGRYVIIVAISINVLHCFIL